MLLLKKGSKEGKINALLQPGEGVQLGSQYMTDRDNFRLILAQLTPAIVVAVCVTTMVGLLLMLMTCSSFLYMTGS